MNRQIRTGKSVQTMTGSIAMLLCGIAFCTWIGGAIGAAPRAHSLKAPINRQISHLINPENSKAPGHRNQAINGATVADSGLDKKSAQGVGAAEKPARGKLREAIYSVPRSGGIGHAGIPRLML